MASFSFSPVLYRGCIEWCFNELRECYEVSKSTGLVMGKRSPEVEFTVPLNQEETKKYPIRWHIGIHASSGSNRICTYLRTNSSDISCRVGIKGSLTVVDESGNKIEHHVSFAYLLTDKVYYHDAFFSWPVNPDSVPFSSCVKLICSLVAYNMNCELNPQTQLQSQGPCKLAHNDHTRGFSEELTKSLNKDRTEGASTDAIIKYDEEEYKVHKCVLAVQSDFFKARFSDRWDMKDGELQSVDMNDPDVTADIIEALLCSAYTGKVENLEMALKLLPVTDKYQFKKLKLICESLISSQLNKENVLEMYVLAKQCDAQYLKSKCETLVRL